MLLTMLSIARHHSRHLTRVERPQGYGRRAQAEGAPNALLTISFTFFFYLSHDVPGLRALCSVPGEKGRDRGCGRWGARGTLIRQRGLSAAYSASRSPLFPGLSKAAMDPPVGGLVTMGHALPRRPVPSGTGRRMRA